MGAEKDSDSNPLPRGPLLALAGVFMTNALSSTVLLPFAAFMVDSFHVTDNKDSLGYYAGFLASSFSFGLLCSSIFWGIVSDRIGRRPVLLFGLANNFVCALAFGFSVNFRMAILSRFFNGLLTGVSGVGKTAVSEITNSRNQASGFSVIGVCWGIGLLFGPALGGFLCQPVDKYPFIPIFHKGSLFDHFPYALPCMVLAALTAVGFMIVFRYLPETKGLAKAVEEEEIAEEGSRLVRMGGQLSDEDVLSSEKAVRLDAMVGAPTSKARDEDFEPVSLEVLVHHKKKDVEQEGAGEVLSSFERMLGGGANSSQSDRQEWHGTQRGDLKPHLQQHRRSNSAAISRRTSLEATALAVETAGAGLHGLEKVTPTFDYRASNIFRGEEEGLSDDQETDEPASSPNSLASNQTGLLSGLARWIAGMPGRRKKQYKRVKSHDVEIAVGEANESDRSDGSGVHKINGALARMKRFLGGLTDIPSKRSQKGGLISAMLEKEILIVMIIYCMLSFIFGAFDEVFPLWSLTDWQSGGLNFGTNNVGMAQTAGGVALIPFQLFAYPWLVKQVGPLQTARVGMCSGVLLTLFPLIRVFGHHRTLVQLAASGAMMVRSISSLCVFTSIFILLTNAVSDPEHLGGMNGIAASAAAVSRAFAPTAGGSVFAWSVGQHGVFPLDYHLPFVITGIVLSIALGISILLPKSIDERKFVTTI